MKNFEMAIFVFFLLASISINAQDPWKNWDNNYPLKNYEELMNFEKNYADSVENDTSIFQSYYRYDKYRINAKYLGQSRKVNEETIGTMNFVNNLFYEEFNYSNIIQNEFLFEINGIEVWMPIQQVLEKPLKREIEVGQLVMLYCMFFNSHSIYGKRENIFLVSEFRNY